MSYEDSEIRTAVVVVCALVLIAIGLVGIFDGLSDSGDYKNAALGAACLWLGVRGNK